MADGPMSADFFELRGPAQITYNLRSGLLHYRGPTRPPQRDFVEVVEVSPPLEIPIGRLVTATLGRVPDGDTSTVTVLLPEVTLVPPGGEGPPIETPFETVAVFTATQSSVGGPGLVAGPVQLYTHAQMEGVAHLGGPGCSCELSAVLNLGLPGPDAGPGRLTVEGECTLGSTGYTVELVRHESQGTNPRFLLLDLVVAPPPPDTAVLPVVTKYPVRYEEQTTDHYDTVAILPDGPAVPVQIIT